MATLYFSNHQRNDRLAQLWEDLGAEAVPLQPEAAQAGTRAAAVLRKRDEGRSRNWRVDLSTLFENIVTPETPEPLPSTDQAVPREAAFSEAPSEAVHEAVPALSTPFHWEPKPAWVNVPGSPVPTLLNPADPVHFESRPKIPSRPLHKQPFYRRIYFYLRRWLSRPK